MRKNLTFQREIFIFKVGEFNACELSSYGRIYVLSLT